jgi:hypothetical protein
MTSIKRLFSNKSPKINYRPISSIKNTTPKPKSKSNLDRAIKQFERHGYYTTNLDNEFVPDTTRRINLFGQGITVKHFAHPLSGGQHRTRV